VSKRLTFKRVHLYEAPSEASSHAGRRITRFRP